MLHLGHNSPLLTLRYLSTLTKAVRPQPRSLADQDLQLLRAVLWRREQDMKMIVQEENRLEKFTSPVCAGMSKNIYGCGNASMTWMRTLRT